VPTSRKAQAGSRSVIWQPKASGFSNKLRLPSLHIYRGPQQCRQLGKEKEKQQRKPTKYTYREWREGDCTPRQCDCMGFGPPRWVLLE